MSDYLSTFRVSSLCVVIGLLGVFPAAARQAEQADKATGQIEITRQMTYPGGSVESAQVLDWIKKASPAYAPLLEGGRITVTRQTRLTGVDSPQLQARASDALSPLPLPMSGINGERYQVNHQLPDGNRESWTYEWRGGGGGGSWVTVDYSYHKGSGRGERPSPNREIR